MSNARVLRLIIIIAVTSAIRVYSIDGKINKRSSWGGRGSQYNATHAHEYNRTHTATPGKSNLTYFHQANRTNQWTAPYRPSWLPKFKAVIYNPLHWMPPHRNKRWLDQYLKLIKSNDETNTDETSNSLPTSVKLESLEASERKEITPSVHHTYRIGEAMTLFKENEHHETEKSPNTREVIIQAPRRKTHCGPRMKMARGKCRLIW